MKQVVIADEYFINKDGHYYEYNKSVQEILREHNYDVTIYANKGLDPRLQQELGAIPYLAGLSKSKANKIPLLGKLWDRFRFWKSLSRQLDALYSSEKHKDSIFFFTTVMWHNVLPIARAASRHRQKSMVLFRLPVSELTGMPRSMNGLGRRLYQYAITRMMKQNNVSFFTDSDVIASECNETFHCNMRVLPIPHLREEASPVPDEGATAAPPIFSVYAPGSIRTEKGIEFITQSFEYLDKIKHPLLEKTTLVTQYSATGSAELNNNIKERLSKLAVKNIFLGNLSSDDYNRTLFDAHIILVPYDIAHGYRARTSGIMSETIAACKPFITSKDSWMSVQANQYQTGLAVHYGAVTEFADALSTLIDQYPLYKDKALKARDSWLAFHSRENFFKILEQGM